LALDRLEMSGGAEGQMTRPLRRAHLRIWIGLACVLAGLVAASLWQRPGPPAVNPDFVVEQSR